MQESVPASRNALLTAWLIALATLTYWPSTAALWNYWLDGNHSGTHGLLVAPLSVWLLYRARMRLAAIPIRPSLLAGTLLIACSIAWLVFWRAGIQELHLLLLPVLMGLAVYAALGFRAALAVAFPIGYLYFAVPAWGIFGRSLQDLTIWSVGWMAPLIGVPAQIRGDLVILPGVGVIEIASGCSGVNFFTVGLAVAALLGELEQASLRRRALLVTAMGALAVFANWLRVLIIVDAGYTTNMRHVLVSRGHYTFGWVLFTTVMVTFVWLVARPKASSPPVSANSLELLRPAPWSAYVAAMVGLVAMPLLVYVFIARLDGSAPPVAFGVPVGRGGWQGPLEEEGSETWKPDFVGPHSQWSVAYRGPEGHSVEMVAIGYSVQGQGRELVNEENALFGASVKLDTVAEDKVTLGPESYIETVVADEQGRRSLVWSVYDIGGREFVTPLLSQLWYGVRSLGGAPYSILFAFRTPCLGSCDAARVTMRSFATSMGAALLQSAGRGDALTARSGGPG